MSRRLQTGPDPASIVVVADPPSRYELTSGQYPDKEKVKIVLQALQAAGFDINDILFLPSYSGAKPGDVKLTGPELQANANEHLIPRINAHKRKAVFVLGNMAASAIGLLPEPSGVTGLVGAVRSLKTIEAPIVVCTSPAQLLRKPDETIEDYLASVRLLYDVANNVPQKNIFDPYIVDLVDEDSYDILFESAVQSGRVAYDHETTGRDHLRGDFPVSLSYYSGDQVDGLPCGFFWHSHDQMRQIISDDELAWHKEKMAEFFVKLRKKYELWGWNSVGFDDPMTSTFLGRPVHCDRDGMVQTYVLDKYAGQSLKNRLFSLFGISDYEKATKEYVQKVVERRGKIMYENEAWFEDEVRCAEVLGYELTKGKYSKSKGQAWKYPEGADKKRGAFALMPLKELRVYNVIDSIATFITVEEQTEQIAADPKLTESEYHRMRIVRRFSQGQQRGLLLDKKINKVLSKTLEESVERIEEDIKVELDNLGNPIPDFNPNSGDQLRAVLYGKPVVHPVIDPTSLYGVVKEDLETIDEAVDTFLDNFYDDYSVVKQLVDAGNWDSEVAKSVMLQQFHELYNGVTPAVLMKTKYLGGLYSPDPKTFTKTGLPGVGAVVLQNLYEQEPRELLQLILMRNKATKLKSTFVDNLAKLVYEDGAIRPEYLGTRVKSGRGASKNPNGQNFPEAIRGQCVARPGFEFGMWDLSQAEVRMAAAFSQDQGLIDAFLESDFHVATGAMVLNVPMDQVTKQQRQAFKTLNFALLYGASAFKIAMMLNCSVQEAEELIMKYFSRFTDLQDWMEGVREFARENLYVSTAFGTKVDVRNIISTDFKTRGHAERFSVNAVIQGSSGELTTIYNEKIHEECDRRKLESYFVNNTHDACTDENKLEHADEIEALSMEILSAPVGNEVTDRVPFVAEYKRSRYWYGEVDLMQALDKKFKDGKSTLPWELFVITDKLDDYQSSDEREELEEMEEVYYKNNA